MSNKKDFKQAKQKRRPKTTIIFNIISVGASIIAIVYVITTFFNLETTRTRNSQLDQIKEWIKYDIDLPTLIDKLKTFEEDRILLSNQISDLKQLPKDAKLFLKISELRSEVTILKNEIDKLNVAILDNPERAISVPLLRKDMDNLKESYNNDLGGLRGEISRVFEQNKWFIGLMFTIALGVLGLGVSNFFQYRRIGNKS